MKKKLLAALLLVVLGRLASPVAVPVYDGIGTDDPYRYVGTKNAPATTVSATAQAPGGVAGSLQVRSAENGPQLLVDLGSGGFSTTASSVTLTSTAVKGDGDPTPQGTIDGNIYRITASPGARLLPDQIQGFLYLRAAVMTRPNPVIVHRDTPTAAWQKVKTVQAGRDIVSTPFRALGDYAVVRLPGSTPLSAAGSLSTGRIFLLGSGVFVLVIITILVLRRPARDQE